jgi:hypothetical protein
MMAHCKVASCKVASCMGINVSSKIMARNLKNQILLSSYLPWRASLVLLADLPYSLGYNS